ncbi:hypothetical protein ABZ816_25265 [Actinosynnema sp. NPDC047251]|uniref:SD-repeat containing protein B domain-containing protein n=1 Tax=Saccharothrix espanaensis (strain ATCC 51144 / DSM 44229 / JCM 9112 / NBRC 15066 / NRRL 15764) TaxID=1179773 RepID=K0K2C2_SACES|nr:hypothetical protein [Saccharothrix espanaensis]CCH31717.1 hypothetical protein BN6_44360 [Saccharothrix espanaensis DSM 44229]
MSRLCQSTGALLLTALLALGVSVGPAAAQTTDPPETSRPAPTDTTTPQSPTTETPIPVPTTPAPTPAPPYPPDPAPPGSTPTAPVEPPTAAAPEAGVDLRIAVVYDKPAYYAHEVVRARATVTNVGTATATGVGVTSTGNIDSNYWSGFGWPGVTLEPGQSAQGTASGYAHYPERGEVRLVVTTTAAEPDASPADNTVTAAVPISIVRGTYSGVVYLDTNGSGTMDPGERAAGFGIRLQGGHPWGSYTVHTDSNGRFTATVPVGRYVVEFAGSEWWFPPTGVEIDDVDDPDVLLRGAGRVEGQITATAAFTKPAYAQDDISVLALTLTNSGPTAVPELKATCWSIYGVLVDLGELGSEQGTSVPGGTSRTYPVTFRVTPEAARAGHLRVDCTVGAPPNGNGAIRVEAVARVPGAHADRAVGRLLRLLPRGVTCAMCPPAAEPLTGVKVYLRNQVTGQVVARAVSGLQGSFEFHDLPADLYDFGVVGPWKATGPFEVRAGDNGGNPTIVYVESAPDQPDPDQLDPGAGPPPGGAPAHDPDALAATGVGVGWLALSGLLSLVAGVALVSRLGRRA